MVGYQQPRDRLGTTWGLAEPPGASGLAISAVLQELGVEDDFSVL